MYKTIQAHLSSLKSSIMESSSPDQIIEDAGVRYTKYLKFANEALAEKVRDIAAHRDGVTVELEGANMYFANEDEFNHIWYHYKAKITPGNVTVEDLKPSIDESLEGTYQVGRFTTTHTTAAFHHVCDHYGFTIERDPVGIGSRCFVALNAAGEKVGSFMDGVGTFYNDKLPKTTSEDFMAGAVAPEAAIVDESNDGEDLANRIDSFLSNYAKLDANYDPQYDDPDERWNGPDSAMMAMAAKALRAGMKPPVVHSDIGSGCYKNYFDPEVQSEHAAILKALDGHRGIIDEAPTDMVQANTVRGRPVNANSQSLDPFDVWFYDAKNNDELPFSHSHATEEFCRKIWNAGVESGSMSLAEDVMMDAPTKMVKLTPSQTQLGKGAEALRGALSMGGFSSSELRKCCSVVYSAMVGGMPSVAKSMMDEGHNASPTVFDDQKPSGATVYVFAQDDMDPVIEECNLPPGRHVLTTGMIENMDEEEAELDEATKQPSEVTAFLKLLLALSGSQITLKDLKTSGEFSYYLKSPAKLIIKPAGNWLPLIGITNDRLAEAGINWTIADVVTFLDSSGVRKVKRPTAGRPQMFSMYDSEQVDDDSLNEDDDEAEIDEARNSMADYRRSKGWAILPATMHLYGKRVVDIKTAASEWAPSDETILVCMKVDDERITFLASSGPSSSWMSELNTTHECFHDQTQASKGYYKVLNIVGFRDGEIVDKVNDIGLNVKASVAVFK